MDVLRLCPIYESPGADNGYEISDFYAINPDFGAMADFDELLQEAHARGFKIMMDMVLNHTSDQHLWFKEPRCSKDNPKQDYYFWREGKNGLFPNNWESYFSGSVWEYDQTTDAYTRARNWKITHRLKMTIKMQKSLLTWCVTASTANRNCQQTSTQICEFS